MRVPISWLADYVDIILPVEQLAEKLTIAGLEVKQIEYFGIPGGSDPDRLVWDPDKLVIGQILEVNPHPDADRLVLATVDFGGGVPEVTVTGAPNLFSYLDRGDLTAMQLYSPFAMEGVTLYDGHKPGQVKMKLKGRPVRGIHNRCMLCSEKELGLSDDHEGIIIIDGAESMEGLIPGNPLREVLGDAVLDIEIIPNIARCASVVGVAREVAALTGQKLREPDYHVKMEGPSIEGRVKLTTDKPELNPRFVALVIENVEQRPSPYWMQHRLRLAGQRPINAVVDISNYVMLEMGQPNHTFDFQFLRRRADAYDPEGPVHIHTRLPEEGETLTTLDGIKHQLLPFNILVTDPAGILSLGGIMGGIESEINDQTTDVLLEAAAWNYLNIRRSATALRINSEASFRFGRGVHPSQALLGAKRAAELLRRYADGTVSEGVVDYYPNPPMVRTIHLTPQEVGRIGGIDLSAAETQSLLESLQFTVNRQDSFLDVTAPDHRLDIEGTHDLIEEICRMYGYDRIPTKEMSDTLPPQRNTPNLDREERIRDILVQLGLQEVITYRLTRPENENQLLPASRWRPDDRPYLTLSNPISTERIAMRHSLLASVLEITASNSRFKEQIQVFEVGKIYLVAEDEPLPDELLRLVAVLRGPRRINHWGNNTDEQLYDYFDLKGIIENLISSLHIDDLVFKAADHPTFYPGRTARLMIGELHLGWMGEIHPLVLEKYDFKGSIPVFAADLDLEILLPLIPDAHQIAAIPAYPSVHEDIAVIVDKAVPEAEISAAIERAGGFLLSSYELFDVYQGGSIPAGKKSLAYHLTFRSPDRTLTDKAVRKNRERIVMQLEKQFSAKLRDA